MRMTTRWRSLTLSAVAATMLVAAPAAHAHGEGQSPGKPSEGQHPGLPFAKFCQRAVNNPHLSADQRAAVRAACARLKADLRAAKARLAAASAAARAEVKQAHDAAVAACTSGQLNSGSGQFDGEPCRDARAEAEQAKQEAMQDLNAAHRQFVQDVHAAVNAFKSALRPIKDSLQGGGHAGPGKNGPPATTN